MQGMQWVLKASSWMMELDGFLVVLVFAILLVGLKTKPNKEENV